MKIVRTINQGSSVGQFQPDPPCCTSGNCPALHLTEDHMVIVQGQKLEKKAIAIDVPIEEDIVMLPVDTFKELVAKL